MKFSLATLSLAAFFIAGASASYPCEDVCDFNPGQEPSGNDPFGCNINLDDVLFHYCQEGEGMERCIYKKLEDGVDFERDGYCLFLEKEAPPAAAPSETPTGAPSGAPTLSTGAPTGTPTGTPTGAPSGAPTLSPDECVEPEYPEDPGSDATCGHSCGCFTCGDVIDNGDDTIDVTVNHCKSGTISWMCCIGYDGGEGNCEVTGCSPESGTAKCGDVAQSEFVVTLPADATTFTINTHDGQTQGLDDMNNNVCGGNGNQGGKCAKKNLGYTAHCLIDFDIATDCGCPQRR